MANRNDPSGQCTQDENYNWWDDDQLPESDFGNQVYPGNCTDSPQQVAWANSMAPGSVGLNGSALLSQRWRQRGFAAGWRRLV